jgi:hypothetical protein
LFTLTARGRLEGYHSRNVVPAQAGTHTPCRLVSKEVVATSCLISHAKGYGSFAEITDTPPQKKIRLAAGLSFSLTLPQISSELAILLALLALPALAVRILLLLAGLLAAALLLTGLLTRVLILLAWVLVLVRHSASPFWRGGNTTPE